MSEWQIRQIFLMPYCLLSAFWCVEEVEDDRWVEMKEVEDNYHSMMNCTITGSHPDPSTIFISVVYRSHIRIDTKTKVGEKCSFLSFKMFFFSCHSHQNFKLKEFKPKDFQFLTPENLFGLNYVCYCVWNSQINCRFYAL